MLRAADKVGPLPTAPEVAEEAAVGSGTSQLQAGPVSSLLWRLDVVM
jgi:hypothetical protein